MRIAPADFIGSVLSPVLPPDNPLLRSNWAALAFDRNWHEALAPDDVWTALLSAHADRSIDPHRIGIISFDALQKGCEACFVAPRLDDLRAYWLADAQFLHDHYIFSPSYEWVARLDQDVSLFAGEERFLSAVVAELGGLDRLMERMQVEFDPGPGDPVGLARYLKAITAALRSPNP
jgi:hypothetical protein